jgi:uncharacterized protein (TIGR03790 family)
MLSRPRGWALLVLFLPLRLWAGGGGLNTVVVINQSSSNSLALGNYYCERRQVPPQNVLYLDWSEGSTSWTNSDFEANLLNPLLDLLAQLQLTNQIEYIVLSMDIPFQTLIDGSVNGTTSALFYGLKTQSGPGWVGATNSYAASEAAFAQAPPASAPGYSFLCTMITGNTLAQAQAVVDAGVNSDGTFPSAPVVLEKTSDPARNVRFTEFDNAIFNTRLRGNYSMLRVDSDSIWGETNLLGYETGLANFSLSPNAFVPGAIADSLTSFGGIIFGPNGQTTELACTESGAAGSYGTVVEPDSNTDKFPNAQVYFYQARGFSLAECYYQSLNVPFEGLIVGEPLAAPFARTGSAGCVNVTSNSVLSGTARLKLQFEATDKLHPLQQVDLFVDGTYFQTITNLEPSAGNVLNLTLNGYALSCAVPTNATLNSLAATLAAAINSFAGSNLLNVAAWAYGDRVELHAGSTNPLASPFSFTDSSTTNVDGRYYRVVYVPGSVASAVEPVDFDPGGGFRMQIATPFGVPYTIQASTNLADWLPIFTNSVGGSQEFVDPAAPQYPNRCYRIAASAPQPRPLLSAGANINGTPFVLHIAAQTASPYAIQASINLADWVSLFTNLAGGSMAFVDAQATNLSRRSYRALLLPALQPAPQLTLLSAPANAGPSFRIDGAVQPYTIQVSTNLTQWTSLFSNLTVGEIQTSAGSALGAAPSLTTFLATSGGTFLDSQARPMLGLDFYGSLSAGDTLQFTVFKTNGSIVTLTVTSQSNSLTLAALALELFNEINTTPALESGDGVYADDLGTNLGLEAGFNVYARGLGLAPSGIQVQLIGSGYLATTAESPTALNQNLSDLQPRAHFYVTTGAPALAMTLALETTKFSDGYHQLDFVAYEGSNVRTQTRLSLPVIIQNSSLRATLSLLDLPAIAPVEGAYHLQVTASTNNVSAITLFSTGGAIGVSTNQSSATFVVNGPSLGVGLHPFYAVVRTATGLQYRTQTQWSRLTPD